MVFIIIPVFNRKEFTRNCLKSLFNQTFANFEIIVVDDGSTDGTSEMIRKEFPSVQVLKGDGNLWWAGATNMGINYVIRNKTFNDADYILTLNNDLEVPENYLEALTTCASNYNNSIIGSISVDINSIDRMNFCGVSWNKFTGEYRSKTKKYRNSFKELNLKMLVIESSVLPGRGTLIPRKVFNDIGLFDAKNFPQYAADEDFSLMAKKKGWKLILPTSTYVKSHINETGADLENVKLDLEYYKHLFFSIKSPLNLKIRYRWAMKNSPMKIFYFLIECARILFSVSFKSFQILLFRS